MHVHVCVRESENSGFQTVLPIVFLLGGYFISHYRYNFIDFRKIRQQITHLNHSQTILQPII